jgi:hypothetical protein
MAIKLSFCFGVLICVFSVHTVGAQILNIGGTLGVEFWPTSSTEMQATATSHIEFFMDNDAPFSFNIDPSYSYREGNTLSLHIYLKFVFGRHFKVCPLAGAFFRAGGSTNQGFIAGLSFEKQIKEKTTLFLTTNYLRETQEKDAFSPGGIAYSYDIHYNVLWINIGIKYRIFRINRSE